MRALILLTTAVALATSLWAFTAVQHFADVVRTDAAPAVLQLSTARVAVLRAEEIALEEDEQGPAATGGAQPAPGAAGVQAPAGTSGEFLSQISIANQALAQAAESSAGEAGTGPFQSVQGQVLSYLGVVTRAGEERRRGDQALKAVDLADAYVAVHDTETGILTNIDGLIGAEQKAVDELDSSGWLTWWAVPLWLVPLLALAGLLIGAQLFLQRRLRRTLSPLLLLATAVLAAAAVYCGQHVRDGQFGGDPGQLSTLAVATPPKIAKPDPLTRLNAVLAPLCAQSCGGTLPVPAGVTPDPTMPKSDSSATSSPPAATPDQVRQITTALPAGLALVLIPVAALAVGGLAWAGFLGPINEYRFQQQ